MPTPASWTRLLLATACAALGLQAGQPAGGWKRRLPGWLTFGGEYRVRAEGAVNPRFRDAATGYLLHRVRLNVEVRPAAWLHFFFEGQDARIWGNDRTVVPSQPPYKASMDLRQGYLELGDPDQSRVSLRAGRQELDFGNQRLMGASNWSNTSRTFDAVRAIVRISGWRVDAFASSVVRVRDEEFDRPVTGDNLHGLYASNDHWIPGSTMEGYLFWRLEPGVRAESGIPGRLDFKTAGTRWKGSLAAGFDYAVDMAFQRGSLASDRVSAWAGHWALGYTAANLAAKPRFLSEFNYASGDRNPRDNIRGTFDHLYPTSHGKYGVADQVGWRNIEDLHFGAEFHPLRGWTVTPAYHNWWLASARDWLYAANGAALYRSSDGSAGRHVGQELDLTAAISLGQGVQCGAGAGHIFPGRFLKVVSPGRPHTYPYAFLMYRF